MNSNVYTWTIQKAVIITKLQSLQTQFIEGYGWYLGENHVSKFLIQINS